MLLVIADPAAPYIQQLTLPADVPFILTEDLEKLKTAAPQADAILYASFKSHLLEAVLPFATKARWIHSLWTGVDWILFPELLSHPAQLTNGRGAFRWPLAEWTMGAMLFFAFDLRRLVRQQEQGIWQPFVGSTLDGRTLGIIGYGSIGSAAAERARSFGMNIVALRRSTSYGREELHELMRKSDYVLVAAPLTTDTKGLVDEAAIAAMKPAGVIINVGRGPVIDESALIRALESRRIRGAALDVFDTEPLPADHPFWRLPNVLLSPHTADRVEGFMQPAAECFLENLKRFREGKDLLNVVDKQAGY